MLSSFPCFLFLSCRGSLNIPHRKSCHMEKEGDVAHKSHQSVLQHLQIWVVYTVSWGFFKQMMQMFLTGCCAQNSPENLNIQATEKSYLPRKISTPLSLAPLFFFLPPHSTRMGGLLFLFSPLFCHINLSNMLCVQFSSNPHLHLTHSSSHKSQAKFTHTFLLLQSFYLPLMPLLKFVII